MMKIATSQIYVAFGSFNHQTGNLIMKLADEVVKLRPREFRTAEEVKEENN